MAIKATLKKKAPIAATVTSSPVKTVDVQATVEAESNLEQAVAGETAEDTTPATAVATRTTGAVQVYKDQSASGFGGAWDTKDDKPAQLKMVQGSGKLSKEFAVGTIILDGVELFPPISKAKKEVPHDIRIVPIFIDKQFRQKLSEEAVKEGETPMSVSSPEEVEQAGGTLDWPYGEPMPDNYWEPSARNIFLIESPGDDCDHASFCIPLDEKLYALAVYYAAGAAFRRTSQKIYQNRKSTLLVPVLDAEGKPVFDGKIPRKEPMLYKCVWTLSWDNAETTKSGHNPYRPTVSLLRNELTGPELRGYCASILEDLTGLRAKAAAASDE